MYFLPARLVGGVLHCLSHPSRTTDASKQAAAPARISSPFLAVHTELQTAEAGRVRPNARAAGLLRGTVAGSRPIENACRAHNELRHGMTEREAP
jgi:hypothetical protein